MRLEEGNLCFSFEGGTKETLRIQGTDEEREASRKQTRRGASGGNGNGKQKKKRRCLLESPDTKTLAKNGVLDESVRSKWMAPNRNAFLVLI